MPCTGPSQPTDSEVDKIYNDVMNLLKEKYNIFNFAPPNYIGFIESRRAAENQLRAALKEVIYQENCESW